MGTLFSLPKSATIAALDASEVALLVFGLLLVAGLIGELKSRTKIFEWLVIIGVAGELLGDGGIFLFSRSLQSIEASEIATLNREVTRANERAQHLTFALQPRSLSQLQIREITEACRPFAKPGVKVLVLTTLGPGLSLGLQIWKALHDAGFDVGIDQTTEALVEITVGGPPEADPLFLTAIENALRSQLLVVDPLRTVYPRGSPVTITVGAKLVAQLPQ